MSGFGAKAVRPCAAKIAARADDAARTRVSPFKHAGIRTGNAIVGTGTGA